MLNDDKACIRAATSKYLDDTEDSCYVYDEATVLCSRCEALNLVQIPAKKKVTAIPVPLFDPVTPARPNTTQRRQPSPPSCSDALREFATGLSKGELKLALERLEEEFRRYREENPPRQPERPSLPTTPVRTFAGPALYFPTQPSQTTYTFGDSGAMDREEESESTRAWQEESS